MGDIFNWYKGISRQKTLIFDKSVGYDNFDSSRKVLEGKKGSIKCIFFLDWSKLLLNKLC